MMPPTQILISAGEASGDMYAARLAAALRARADVQLFGMGGPRMREAGVETVADCSEVSLVGIVEIAKKYPALKRVWKRLLGEADRRKPQLAILTDFPGFHLRLARALKSRGVPSVYFVCPQFWAWRPWRANLVRRRFVRGLCIFPFEEAWYRARGVQADFIGHPLVGNVAARRTRAEFAADFGLDAAQAIVALLPGSRSGEIAHHMPGMIEACRQIQKERAVQFVLALAPGVKRSQISQYLPAGIAIHVVEDATYDALGAADVCIVSSGTATVEAALMDAPMIVVYRLAPLTAAIARSLVRTTMFAMVNLIAGERVVPELVQKDFTPERLASEAIRLLDSPDARAEMRRGLAKVREKLGPPGAVDRAADLIAGMLNELGAK
ncbi:MAG TPA: lipid-A-disaccharide synthase [Candidatus Acidoferrales bacterium]|nr:lipid-A-disaccharide synthase [Candidatus Acidoferrales bacterium]